MKKVVIVSGCRTAVGTFGGSLKDVEVAELGAIVLRETLARAGLRPEYRQSDIGYRPGKLGSGISMGHPIGCTGARQLVTAISQMKRDGLATGLISMCIGGGMGMAMVISR